MKRWQKIVLAVAGSGAILGAPVVPKQLHWTYSIETLEFSTQNRWLNQGQYALKERDDGYYVCLKNEQCAQDIPLHEEPLSFDVSKLAQVQILGTRAIDFFEDKDTKDIQSFDGDLADFKLLQTEPGYPQPEKTVNKPLGSVFVPFASAVIAKDATSTVGPSSNVVSLNWNHTVTTGGANRFLMVFIDTNDTTAGDRLVQTASYNGVRMSTTTAVYASATVSGQPFHLANPSTGLNSVSVTFGGTTSTAIGAAMSFTGIDQNNPFVQNATACAVTGCAVTNASSTSWILMHAVANDDDTNNGTYYDETCLYATTTQWIVDTGSGSLGSIGLTCSPAIPNASVNRIGIDATSLSNTVGRYYELRNSSPIVTATSTSITYTTADLYGFVYSLNGESAQDVFINYGDNSASGGAYDATTTLQYKNTTGEFSASLSGLTHSTTYYYRVGMVSSSSVITYDTEGKFKTPCNPSGNTCTDTYTMEENFHSSALLAANTVQRFGAWVAPTGVTSADVACWGAGGGGGIDTTNGGGGGGGGAFASSTISVTPGTTYWVTIGAYGNRDSATNAATSTFATTTVIADGGIGTTGQTGGRGGLASLSTGDIKFDGGDGGNGDGTNDVGGGGAGGAGPHGAGGDGVSPAAAATQGGGGGTGDNGSGGAGGSGGNGVSGALGGQSELGGGGGGGSDTSLSGGRAGYYGAGGGGADANATIFGNANGVGAGGKCVITYTVSAGGAAPSKRQTEIWFD